MTVDLTRREEAALITLNRPEALNALSFSIASWARRSTRRRPAMPGCC